jgi:hypothetical protein
MTVFYGGHQYPAHWPMPPHYGSPDGQSPFSGTGHFGPPVFSPYHAGQAQYPKEYTPHDRNSYMSHMTNPFSIKSGVSPHYSRWWPIEDEESESSSSSEDSKRATRIRMDVKKPKGGKHAFSDLRNGQAKRGGFTQKISRFDINKGKSGSLAQPRKKSNFYKDGPRDDSDEEYEIYEQIKGHDLADKSKSPRKSPGICRAPLSLSEISEVKSITFNSKPIEQQQPRSRGPKLKIAPEFMPASRNSNFNHSNVNLQVIFFSLTQPRVRPGRKIPKLKNPKGKMEC